MDDARQSQVEGIVGRWFGTPARAFPALRASGVVDLALVRAGAREHPVAAIRWRCLTLLDHLDGDASVPVYLDALRHDPVPRVRRHALHALACEACKVSPLGVDIVPPLTACARHDPNAKVRAQAAALLARRCGPA